MSDSSYKPSLSLESLLSGDIAGDSERFLLFTKAYYEWMQSCRIEISQISGTFQRGETVVGNSSGASGIISEIGTGYLVVKVTGNNPGEINEIFTGLTSNATGRVSRIKDNVIRKSGNVLNYRNIETSIDEYVKYLKDELYPSIPLDYYGDKRLLATKFKGFFQSKSNEESYRFLFRLLYDEEIDFYYPGEDLLRVSAGNFERTEIIRVTADAFGVDALGVPYTRSIFEFLNKTIQGRTSGFLANVVDIKKFFIGSAEVAEFTLKLVSGTFVGGETIVDIADANLTATTYGIVSGFNIIDGGSGYTVGNIIGLSGDGSEAQARVSSIKESPISALSVDAIGYGYRLNTLATIDNTGTGGSGLIVKVTGIEDPHQVTYSGNTYTFGKITDIDVISRGEGYYKTPSITLEDTLIKSIGMLYDDLITIQSGGTNYGVGNTINIIGGSGTSAAGIVASVQETVTYDFLFEDGMRLSLEGGTPEDVLKNEDWDVLGPITRIEFTNFGTGYTLEDLPTLTVNSTTGSSANIIVTGILGSGASVTVDVANNIAGIGSIRAVEITNFGIGYTNATADTTTSGDGNAVLTPIIAGLGIREGTWVDDDGKIDYKYIQDSYFYQDFSYVIKSGLGFGFYKDTLKKIIHPAGLQLFGEILIRDVIDLSPDIVTDIEILRNFERMLVQIISAFTVGAEYEYSRISWSIKVEADAVITAVDNPIVHEYVIHLVPEGDDISGVTNVDMAAPQSVSNVKKYRIEISPISNVSSDILDRQPLTKMVVSKSDEAKGYGSATWGEATLGETGLYDDVSGYTLAEFANTSFNDTYLEYPTRGTLVTVSDKYPDVAHVEIETTQEYILDVPLHGFEYVPVDGVPISLYANTAISEVSTVGFDLYYSTIESATVAATPSPLITGQAGSQRSSTDIFRTEMNIEVAPNQTQMYAFIFGDESIGDIGAMTIGGNTLNDIYEGQSGSYENYTFNSIVRDFPKTFTEVVKKIDTNEPAHSAALPMSKEYVNQYYSRGFGYQIFDEVTLATYANTSISTFAENGLEQYHADVDAISIPMFLSPLSYGQSQGGDDPRDIFRREMNVEIFTFLDASISIEPYVISNEVSTNDIELDREIPIIVRFDIPVEVHKEYSVVVSPAPTVLDVTPVFSSVAPQKFQAAEGIVSAYGLTMQELTFLQYGEESLNGLPGESLYQGIDTRYSDNLFTSYYRTYPFSDSAMTQRIITVKDSSVNIHKEIMVSYTSGGPKPIAYWDAGIYNFASDTFAERGNEHFELYFDTVESDIISVFPSPLPTGQSITSKSVTDIFRTEMVQQVRTTTPVTAQSMGDAILADAANETFEDYSPESKNYGVLKTYSQNLFSDYFRTFPRVGTEMVRQIPIIDDASAPENHDTRMVVSYLATGFRFSLLAEKTFAEDGETLISVLADRPLNEVLDSVYDNTIKASPSPTISGFSGNIRMKEDIFQNEFIVKPSTNVSPYNTQFEDLRIDILDDLTFETLVPGTGFVLGDQTLGTEYQQVPLTLSNYIQYAKIAGTVASSTQDYSAFTVSDYLEIPIEDVDDIVFSAAAPVVVGTGVDFSADYNVYDVFATNNEYFTVEAIVDSTHMVVDRFPSAPYSGINAYKRIN